MTKMSRALALVAVLALPLLPACKNPNNPEDADLPTSEELSIALAPGSMEFRHVVGQSPCPQLVGRQTIRNTGRTPFTTDVRSRGTAPLSFSPATPQTVQPGSSVTIDIFFTCASQNSFIVTVDTLRENPGQQASVSLPPGSFDVFGTIVR